MTGNATVRGIVLTSMPVGEYDRRLLLLTKERGKISAFVRGARRPNSTLLAVSQPFTYAEFTLYEGRSSYSIAAAENVNYFSGLRTDIKTMCLGQYFCELADYFTRENNDESMLLKLLFQALRALESGVMEAELVRLAYELKAVSIFGEAPQVFECVKCGRDTLENAYFSAQGTGVLCTGCAALHGHELSMIRISQSALYALQYIVTTPVEKLFSFRVTDEVYDELRMCIAAYMKIHVDKPMHSLEIIGELL